jgi:hypothetical protein
VVAISSRRATAEKIDGLDEPALSEEIQIENDLSPQAESAPLPSFETATGAAAPAQEVRHSRIASRIAESRRAHPALWIIAILVGVLVGMGMMIVLLPNATNKTTATAPTAPTVSAVATAVPTQTAASGEGEGMTTIGPIEVSAAVTKGATGARGSKGTTPDNTNTGAPAAPLSTSLTGLGGLVGGPSGPSGGTSQGGGGGQLAAADVERVVQSHRAFVRRQCWDPALSARSPGAPSSAKVLASLNVARDGSVSSASASGGEGYPGLATCVQGQVKGWRFPASEGSEVKVPFMFAAQ